MRSIFLILAAAMIAGCDAQPPTAKQQGQPAESIGPAKGVDRSNAGEPLPDTELSDADGEPSTLAAAAGKPVLVNLWATWCAPCVQELPTLEALGNQPGAPRVIAVSQDVAPRGSVDAFLERHQLADLEVWHDKEMALSGKLGAEVLPTTILYDAQGREVWRYVGDLDWTGEEASSLLAEAPAAAAAR